MGRSGLVSGSAKITKALQNEPYFKSLKPPITRRSRVQIPPRYSLESPEVRAFFWCSSAESRTIPSCPDRSTTTEGVSMADASLQQLEAGAVTAWLDGSDLTHIRVG